MGPLAASFAPLWTPPRVAAVSGQTYASYKASIPSLVQWNRFAETSGIVAAAQVGTAGTYSPNSGGAWTGGTLGQAGIPGVSGGKAILTNGSGCMQVDGLSITGFPVSMEAWAYETVTQVDGVSICIGDPTQASGSRSNIYLDLVNSTTATCLGFVSGSFRDIIASPVASLVGQWVHYVTTIAADGTWLLYVNAVMVASGAFAGFPPGMTRMTVGAQIANPQLNFFTGYLAEPGIYNAALTPTQVATLFALGSTP